MENIIEPIAEDFGYEVQCTDGIAALKASDKPNANFFLRKLPKGN